MVAEPTLSVTRSRFNSALGRAAKQLSAHGSKVATLAAYGYQAAAALGLVLAVAHLLTGPEYARFSLTLATAQFAAIGAFEWVRIAATRFYPGPDPAAAPLQKASLGAGFVASALVGGVVIISAMVGGAPVLVVLLGAAVAVGQGLTDLYLTFVRFRGDLGAFARLQSLRATAMIGLAAGGAVLTGTANGALAGIVLAHALLILVAIITDPHLRSTPWRRPSAELIRAQLAYGAPAAGASILYLATTLMARYAISLVAPSAAGAGALLAFDLLQRPFTLVTTAFHALLYPQVVRAYDLGGFAGATLAIRRLCIVELGLIVVLTGGLVVIFALPFVANLIVPADLLLTFQESVCAATLLFATRSVTANIVPVPLHLMHKGLSIFCLSLLDGPAFLVVVGAAFSMFGRSYSSVFYSFLFSSILINLIGILFACHLLRGRSS